jgi:hypothetical protein
MAQAMEYLRPSMAKNKEKCTLGTGDVAQL